jgi:hypothetical protein
MRITGRDGKTYPATQQSAEFFDAIVYQLCADASYAAVGRRLAVSKSTVARSYNRHWERLFGGPHDGARQ